MKIKASRLSVACGAALLLLSGIAQAQQTNGYNSLFIGHSFFRPVAEGMPFHAAEAGLAQHAQTVFFSGGASGAPQAFWENPQKRANIQAVLDTGNIELFGMTYEGTYPTTEGYENWIDYALAQNPNTRFFIGLPWPDFPEDYSDASTYGNFWISGHATGWHNFINTLRDLYPGVDIFCIPYGRGAVELRTLYEAGALPDVVALTSATQDSLFNDAKGHADDIVIDLAQLIWLNAIYEVDLTTYPHDPGYSTDLKAIAQSIMDAHRVDPQSVPALPVAGLAVLASALTAVAYRRLAPSGGASE